MSNRWRRALTTLIACVLAIGGLMAVGMHQANAATGVAFNNSGGGKAANTGSLEFTQTVSGSDRALLVEESTGVSPDNGCVPGATYDGIQMTELTAVHNGGVRTGAMVIWGLVNPPAGTDTIHIAVSGCSGGTPKQLVGVSESFTNVNQSSPWAAHAIATGNSGQSSVSEASAGSGNVMAEFVSSANSVSSAVSPVTSQGIENEASGSTGAGNAGAGWMPSSSSSAQWNVTSGVWGAAVVEINANQVCVDHSETATLGNYRLQGNEFNSTDTFTACSDGKPDFDITASSINVRSDGAPGGYPSVYRGCHWGTCTANDPLPVQVSAMAGDNVTTTDHTTTVSGGIWDDAYDIWYNPNQTTSSNNTGLEMMIWLDNGGGPSPAGGFTGSTVTIDGLSFQVWNNGSGAGETVTYKATTAEDSVTNLALAPFAADAVSRGYLSNSDYLIDVEAGSEIWHGNQGFDQTMFNVCVNGNC